MLHEKPVFASRYIIQRCQIVTLLDAHDLVSFTPSMNVRSGLVRLIMTF